MARYNIASNADAFIECLEQRVAKLLRPEVRQGYTAVLEVLNEDQTRL